MEELQGIQVSKIIPNIAEELYKKVGQQTGLNPDTIFSSGQCENISDKLILALRRKGVQATLVLYYESYNHFFVVFKENGEDWIADPTWQQFLKEPNPELPHVLITKKSELAATLTKLGIIQDKHKIWLEALSVDI